MSRLIVEAVSKEVKSIDVVWHIEIYVSVSLADTGKPVTGLSKSNFRVCSFTGKILEMNLHGAYESEWETQDTEPAGCYAISITRKQEKEGSSLEKWTKGEFYAFGIQARVRDKKTKKTNMGQTVVNVESLGT